VAVALLGPPAGEGHVIGQAQTGQAVEGVGDQRLVGSGALQPAPQLPPRPRPGGQEAGGDIQGRVGVERWALAAGPAIELR
jgi:hypothetical protein